MFNSIHQLISLPSDEVHRLADDGPDRAVHPGSTDGDLIVYSSVNSSAEGPVEHQKLNQTTANDSSAVVWLSFWCSTRFTRKRVTRQKL